MNKFVLFLEKYLAVTFIRIAGLTWQYNLRTPKSEEKVIYAFWHRNMLPLLYLHRNEGAVILISSSKDGEIIAGPAKLLGYKTARGSSGRKGSSATRALIKLGNKHDMAITPDGPKGPSEVIKDGVLFLSYFTKLPIVPIAVDINREKVFNSWDRFRFPHLFCKINITYGEPISINAKDEIGVKKELLENRFKELTKENIMR